MITNIKRPTQKYKKNENSYFSSFNIVNRKRNYDCSRFHLDIATQKNVKIDQSVSCYK